MSSLGPVLDLCRVWSKSDCYQSRHKTEAEICLSFRGWTPHCVEVDDGDMVRQAQLEQYASALSVRKMIMIRNLEARQNAANLSQAQFPLSLVPYYLFVLALLISMPPSTPAATATPPAIASPYMPSLDTLSSMSPCKLWLCRFPGSFSSSSSLYRRASA